jgi:hypothetical protein
MKRHHTIRTLSLLSILGFMLLLPFSFVSAETTESVECLESVTLEDDDFEIRYIEHTTNASEGTMTFVYAVTSNEASNALSHWGLRLCDWFVPDDVAPKKDDTYVTPGDYTTTTKTPTEVVIARSGAEYLMDTGEDTPYTWIKWEANSDPQLGDGGVNEMDIFTVTVSTRIVHPTDPTLGVTIKKGPIGVQTKAGKGTGSIGDETVGLCGPYAECDDPNSVCFTGLEAKSPSLIGWILRLLNLE